MNLFTGSVKNVTLLVCAAFIGRSVCAMDQLAMEVKKSVIQEEIVDISFFKEPEQPTKPPVLTQQKQNSKSPQRKGRNNKKFDRSDLLYPEDIYAELIKYTIGQDKAMMSLATFTHNHLVTVRMRECGMNQHLKWAKPNILLIGPTGCGKTSSLEILAKYLKIPFAVGNATEWTTQGYIGGKWQQLFEKLVANSDSLLKRSGNKITRAEVLKKAGQGIVFIDEIDKLCSGGADGLEVINRVQQELLPAIQGMKLNLDGGDVLDTTNILFIAGGAFSKMIPSNLSSKKSKFEVITPRQLEQYGMLPELAGRLCNIVTFSHLTKDILKEIMKTSHHSFLEQYMVIYRDVYEIELSFADEAIDYIAEVASKQQTGARAIHAMISKIMEPITFGIKRYADKPLHIDKQRAVESLKDILEASQETDNKTPFGMYS